MNIKTVVYVAAGVLLAWYIYGRFVKCAWFTPETKPLTGNPNFNLNKDFSLGGNSK